MNELLSQDLQMRSGQALCQNRKARSNFLVTHNVYELAVQYDPLLQSTFLARHLNLSYTIYQVLLS